MPASTRPASTIKAPSVMYNPRWPLPEEGGGIGTGVGLGAGVGVLESFKAATGADTGVPVLGAGGGTTGVCMDVTVGASIAACKTGALTGTELRALRKASAVWK